jgi:amino acid transporter
MKHQHIDEKILESAMHEVEMEFRVSGMVAPPPGFLRRWQARLDQQRIASENKQAWIFVAIIVVIALGFLSLIGLRVVPELPSYGSFLSFGVNLFTQIVIFFKMVGTIIETLFRTLMGLVPPTSWINVIVSLGVLLLLWVGLMRQYVQKQGVMV